MRAIVVEKGRFEPALHTVEEKEIDRKRVGKWSERTIVSIKSKYDNAL